jgi:hypothetical protein
VLVLPPVRFPVQCGRDERRQHLRQHAGDQLLDPPRAGCPDGRAWPLVDLLDRVGVELAHHAYRVQAHRQHPGEGAEAEDPEEDDGEHHVGHRAGHDHQAARAVTSGAARRRVGRGEHRQRHADQHREQRRTHHDGHRLPAEQQDLRDRREVQRHRPAEEVACVAHAVDERGDVETQLNDGPCGGSEQHQEHQRGRQPAGRGSGERARWRAGGGIRSGRDEDRHRGGQPVVASAAADPAPTVE